MDYQLLKDVIQLVERFDNELGNRKMPKDIQSFIGWVAQQANKSHQVNWDGKANGRSVESAICTSLVHLNRYAKRCSKVAMADSPFSTQDEFIYLVVLRTKGELTKMELINANIHDKATGTQIINRLLGAGFIAQVISESDKRVRLVSITAQGLAVLETHMQKIRRATQLVCGGLSGTEKENLVAILSKLECFHEDAIAKMPQFLEQIKGTEELMLNF